MSIFYTISAMVGIAAGGTMQRRLRHRCPGEQMPAFDSAKRCQETGLDPGLLVLQGGEKVLDPGTLQVLIAAGRTGAAGNGETRP
jgi:hypothetical protein